MSKETTSTSVESPELAAQRYPQAFEAYFRSLRVPQEDIRKVTVHAETNLIDGDIPLTSGIQAELERTFPFSTVSGEAITLTQTSVTLNVAVRPAIPQEEADLLPDTPTPMKKTIQFHVPGGHYFIADPGEQPIEPPLHPTPGKVVKDFFEMIDYLQTRVEPGAFVEK